MFVYVAHSRLVGRPASWLKWLRDGQRLTSKRVRVDEMRLILRYKQTSSHRRGRNRCIRRGFENSAQTRATRVSCVGACALTAERTWRRTICLSVCLWLKFVVVVVVTAARVEVKVVLFARSDQVFLVFR